MQSLRARFIRDTPQEHRPQFALHEPQTTLAQLKAHTQELNALDKEYRDAFKAAADAAWDNRIKAEYREKIKAVKDECADKNIEDIRRWVQENANHPIFMAIAERIGYDATGRKDPVNELPTICEEYRRLAEEGPDFFG